MGAKHQPDESRTVLQNRELSWLQFNRRVQMEADQPKNPLLERAKFLAIVTSNLDEYMQVRYIDVLEGAKGKNKRLMGDISARTLYKRVNKEILSQNNMQYTLFEGICGELYMQGVQLYPVFTMSREQAAKEKELFDGSIRPFVKVLPEGATLSQKQLHLCVKLEKARGKKSRFATVAIPSALPRLYDLSVNKETQCLIRLEDVVKHHLHRLFPRENVEHCALFRVLRNQDFELEDCTRDSMEAAVRGMLLKRRTGQVMRLEAEERMSEEMLTLLMKRFQVAQEQRYRVTGPLDLNKLMMSLYGQVDRPELKYPPAKPLLIERLMGEDVFERIQERDYLLYHPYHSFKPVVHLLRQAAADPAVTEICQTLYRVSGNSPIVSALAEAAENGKRVWVLMESCARFDEENNLFWAERLRRAGCEVCVGFPGLKTHSKITLIQREVDGQVQRVLHLGTGNYHDGTAKLYTDFGLFTADAALAEDAAAFFEGLKGSESARMDEMKKAPEELQTTLLQLIDRERENAEAGMKAGIIAKMNSLCDQPIIDALCAASRAGVRIDLIVRGICCLIPEVEGQSDNIHIRSLVGRHLEHARAFCFENGGEQEVYLSSADWMPRNLYKRVELMFPVKDERCKQAVLNVLGLQLSDSEKCRVRLPGGAYTLPAPTGGEINAQEVMLRDIEGVFDGSALTPGSPTDGEADME